ncbi:UPF0104 family protein [Microcoleus sp. FACHB-1515]|uniref:UPF0104 family protein n=1 Tax=Cyanophyceae TaxID=3028117 RepID=UPI0016823BCE|nr:UPF0104 family protein [Microcoleus sp. FACHB-1515]MBD2089697.1 UPF0104 family protein [Microcoleus sp. FACHB-1515]
MSIVTRLKPYLRWLILGATLFFLLQVLRSHAQEVAAIRLDRSAVEMLAIALAVTLIAHIWAGCVWSWILQDLKQPASASWGIKTYLKTNISKYLPGNVWHFYGRISAAKSAGIPIAAATLSVFMEPLLMATAALVVALIGNVTHWAWSLLSLAIGLAIVHPRCLNPLLSRLQRSKGTGEQWQLQHYPLRPFLGELGFLLLRGTGFLLTLLALTRFDPMQIPRLLGAFSWAWLLGLVIPGAPGGLGVFEATAIALLDGLLPTAIVLSVVALYRLISVLAEAIGAGVAWLIDRSQTS